MLSGTIAVVYAGGICADQGGLTHEGLREMKDKEKERERASIGGCATIKRKKEVGM